jgi:hypothetical protein
VGGEEYFRGEIVPSIERLIDNHNVRIIDLVFIQKDATREVTSTSLTAAYVQM